MASMVMSASTGVLSSLLSKLSVLLSDQYWQRKGVRRDIELLSCELTNMNAALEKLADMENLDGQTKVWRDKVREMGYDIEDCIDIFMHQLGQGEDKDGLFQKIARKIRELRLHYQLANMIHDIKARVEEQSKIRDRYMIDESISTSRMVVEVDPRLPALFEDARRLVGIDGPREEITKLLIEEGGSLSGQLKVLSIVGFGGLGKTTLANQVHAKIKNEFECSAFVSISRTPYMPKILKDILSGVGSDGKEVEDDVQKLVKILRAQLTNKRYLIIIDDLWSTRDWRTIECAFVENNNGSRVITTTRIQDVATACCYPSRGQVFQMQPLNELQSSRLFFKRLFGTQDGCSQQFRKISNDMLRKCRGVPLAITSITSLLANQSMHVEIWEKIYNSMGSELDTNPTLEWMRHVLTLSYNDLSHELKTCLLYLGAYPEDSVIWTNELVRKWLAEGFVRERHGLDLEEAAENCLNELINRSMIQPYFSLRGDMRCRVHDLMLDLIISKCKEENFITVIDRNFTMNEASQVRRISHQCNNRDMALEVERMSPSQVRSYNSIPMADYMPPLSKFELLRVLDMDQLDAFVQSYSICLDLSAINHLFLLRYLRVWGFRLVLPKKFGKLKHLMTLDIEFTILCPLDQLSDFTSLSSLRHLTLPKQGGLVLRNGLSNMCSLRTLIHLDIGTSKSIECIRDLGGLTSLRELNVFCYRSPGDIEDNPDTILAASLTKLLNSNLRYLYFKHVHLDAVSPSAQFWSNFITHPQHLQRLSLGRDEIPKVPNWMVHADRLAYLYQLELEELMSDGIQVLGQLPCLIYLRLQAKRVPEKNIIIHPNTFPSLKNFYLSCELSLLTFEPSAMPRLQRLTIALNARKRGLFFQDGWSRMQLVEGSPVGGIENLASLEEISLFIQAKWVLKQPRSLKVESTCREAINRHPKSQTIRINVMCKEYDGYGHKARAS